MDAVTWIQRSYREPPCVRDLDVPPQAACWILPAAPSGPEGVKVEKKKYVVETGVAEPLVHGADFHAHSQTALLLAVSR